VATLPIRAEAEGAEGCGAEVDGIKVVPLQKMAAGAGKSTVTTSLDVAETWQARPAPRESTHSIDRNLWREVLGLPWIQSLGAAGRINRQHRGAAAMGGEVGQQQAKPLIVSSAGGGEAGGYQQETHRK
jgi:hypothetical protein